MSDWEDIAYGPVIGGGDEWEDIAFGEASPKPQAPGFFEDPIGAIAGTSDWSVKNLIPNLTSADFWTTRPDTGEKISAGQAIAGPAQAALSGLTFGGGDEIVAGGNSILDYLTGNPATYEDRLAESRGIQKSFSEASPVISGALELGGALKTPLLNLSTSVSKALPAAKTLPQAALRTGAITAALAGEGALYGGAYGFGQGEGASRLTGLKEGAESGAKFGAALGAPISAFGEVTTLYKKQIENLGKKLLRSSRGARSSDYAKTAKELDFWDISDDQVTSATSEALDTLESSGILGKSLDPSKILANVLREEKRLGNEVDGFIRSAEKAGAKAVPTFDNALNYLAEGKVPADQVEKYLTNIENLSDAIKQNGGNKPLYVQQQKIAAGSKFDPQDGAANGFWRAVYQDLQNAVETVAPDVAPINQKIRDIKLTKPIFQRGLGGEESKNWVDALFQRLRTSGAKTITAPAIAATAAFGAGAGGPAAALAAGAGYFMTPQGQQKLGNTFKKLAKNGGSSVSAYEKLVPALGYLLSPKEQASALGGSSGLQVTAPTSSLLETSGSTEALRISARGKKTPQQIDKFPSYNSDRDFIASKVSKAEAKMDMKPPEIVEVRRVKNVTEDKLPALFKAVVAQESAGKADAVSHKGAVGLMQVMPATAKDIAKELGVAKYDLKDPETNKKFGEHYLKKMLEMFDGDVELALTAYNQGPNRVKNLLKIHKAKTLKEIKPYLGPDGRAYASSILSKLKKSGIVLT